MAAPTYTYTNDPDNVPLEAVRFLIGEGAPWTAPGDALLSDQEIQFALNKKGPGYGAAGMLATQLQARFSRQASSTAGKLSIQASDKSKAFKALADQFYFAMSTNARPKFGGVLVSDKQRAASDTGTVQPAFTRNQYDNPESPGDEDPAGVGPVDRNGGV